MNRAYVFSEHHGGNQDSKIVRRRGGRLLPGGFHRPASSTTPLAAPFFRKVVGSQFWRVFPPVCRC